MKPVIYLILFISVTKLSAQNLSETLDFANLEYQSNSYQNAIESYKRVLFFDSSGLIQKEVYPKIANCLFKTTAYEEAAQYYDMAYFQTENDSLKNEYLLKKASCLVILKQFDYANIEILNLSDNLYVKQKFDKNLLQGIINFSTGNYVDAETSFKNIAKDSSKIASLFIQNKKIERINPKKAKILSMILPGLGQFYVGDIKNGLNSLVLCSGLFALGVHSELTNGILDATISVLPWFQRYYQGGFYRAEIIAKEKIRAKHFKIYNAILDEINTGNLSY